MAKKKKFKLDLRVLLSVTAVILAIVAVCMAFAPAAVVENTKVTYKGWQLAFGYKYSKTVFGTELGVEVFKFSFMNVLPYLLLLAGIVFGVLSVAGKLGKLSGFISSGCFLAGGVLYFCVVPMCIPASSVDAVGEIVKENLVIGAGAVVAGVLSILAAAATAAKLFVKN